MAFVFKKRSPWKQYERLIRGIEPILWLYHDPGENDKTELNHTAKINF